MLLQDQFATQMAKKTKQEWIVHYRQWSPLTWAIWCAPKVVGGKRYTVSEWEDFHRLQGETIDQLVLRFEVHRHRCAQLPQPVVPPWQQVCHKLLRVVGVDSDDVAQLLWQSNGELPADHAGYERLRENIRRHYHNRSAYGGRGGGHHERFAVAEGTSAGEFPIQRLAGEVRRGVAGRAESRKT